MFTRVLTVIGTLLVWFPILAPFLLSVFPLISIHKFLFDYLMPAELFPSALIGGGLLLWAAFRAHKSKNMIGWGICIAVITFVGGQAIAIITGLASGDTEPGGWQWALVIGSLILYWLSLIVIGIGAVRLLRKVLRKHKSS